MNTYLLGIVGFSSQVPQTPLCFPLLAYGWGFKGQRPSWEQPLGGDPRASDNMQVATGVCAPLLILVFMGIPMLPNFEANVVCGFCFCSFSLFIFMWELGEIKKMMHCYYIPSQFTIIDVRSHTGPQER